VYTSGNNIGMKQTQTVEDTDTAKALYDITQGSVSISRGSVDANEDVNKLLSEDNLEVKRSGTSVTVTSEGSVEQLKALIEYAAEYGSDDDSPYTNEPDTTVVADLQAA